MDLDISHAVLSAKLVMAYEECCTALKRLNSLDVAIDFFGRDTRYTKDEQLAETHKKKATALDTELTLARNELLRRLKPRPVCFYVQGLQDIEHPSIVIIFVTYDTGTFEEFTFSHKKFQFSKEETDEYRFRRQYVEFADDKTRYAEMSMADVSEYGFILGKPVLLK